MKYINIACTALALVPSFLPAPARAENFVVTCSASSLNGIRTECTGHATYAFSSSGPEANIGIEMTAPTTHCSKVAYQVWSENGRGFLGQTRTLDPGQTFTAGIGDGFTAGVHRVRITAIGFVGGCNAGAMHSWGVEARAVLLP